MAVEIDKTKCTGCGLCVEACSLEGLVILVLTDGMAVVDNPDLCFECGACIDACPINAILFPLDNLIEDNMWG